jgi:hypothetical protein
LIANVQQQKTRDFQKLYTRASTLDNRELFFEFVDSTLF